MVVIKILTQHRVIMSLECYRETTLRFQGRAEREAALTKMAQLQKSIDGWEGKNIGQSCNECVIGESPAESIISLPVYNSTNIPHFPGRNAYC